MKDRIIDAIVMICALITTCIVVSSVVNLLKDNDVNSEYNMCVRELVNEDSIEKGCDKYFVNDKWYKEYMKELKKEYKKMVQND